MKKVIITALICAAMGTVSCKSRPEPMQEELFVKSGDTILLNHSAIPEGILDYQTVNCAHLSREVTTAGTVQAIPNQFAYIAPPFGGRISVCHIRMGQQVGSGTPLFEIISPEFTAMQKEYFQAEAEMQMAMKDLQRKEELLRAQVGSQREHEEALNALKQAEKEFENARTALQIHHLDPSTMVLGQPLVVKSPIKGEVIENNVVTGLYLGDDAEPVAVVANLDKVWITAQVKEKDIRFIKEGDPICVEIHALPDELLRGTVMHIDEAVDEETRAIKVISVCDNHDRKLKLGMYASVTFMGDPEQYLELDEKCLLQAENDSYVLLKTGDNILMRREVRPEFSNGGKIYVKQGIREGDVVVCRGGYYFQ